MDYALAYFQRGKGKDNTVTNSTHHMRFFEQISYLTYKELRELNHRLFDFDRKKYPARILMGKSTKFIDSMGEFAIRGGEGSVSNIRQIEIDTIEHLSDLANGFYSYWKTAEAELKRSFGRGSAQMAEFHEIRSIGIPFCGVFGAVRNLVNHDCLPVLRIKSSAKKDGAEIFDILLDIDHLRSKNKRNSTLIFELSSLNQEVSVLSFFDSWLELCLDLVESVLSLQAREYNLDAMRLKTHLQKYDWPSDAGLMLVEYDEDQFSGPKREMQFCQTIINVPTMNELVG